MIDKIITTDVEKIKVTIKAKNNLNLIYFLIVESHYCNIVFLCIKVKIHTNNFNMNVKITSQCKQK